MGIKTKIGGLVVTFGLFAGLYVDTPIIYNDLASFVQRNNIKRRIVSLFDNDGSSEEVMEDRILEIKHSSNEAEKIYADYAPLEDVTNLNNRIYQLEEDLLQSQTKIEQLNRKQRGPSIAEMLDEQRKHHSPTIEEYYRSLPIQGSVRSSNRHRMQFGPTDVELTQSYLDAYRAERELCDLQRQLGRPCSR
jgi:hypothetical protein